MVITRFAPSPTGNFHIGSARTALFNWLFAKRHGGKFLLRIEDTDKERSTQESSDLIYKSLKWLQLDWDEDIVLQHKNIKRHQEVANLLLAEGKAYKCFTTPAELEEAREKALREGRTPRYDRKWRDAKEHPSLPYAIRLKAPLAGKTEVQDLVAGNLSVNNEQLDDMVLLRADGTPTYMLAVVVDDHDMGITHVIRGNDHINNTFRQKQIYEACGWKTPEFGHIPLIHGADGAKLSKRHGATNLEEYEKQGFMPDAMLNYLLRLGWSHKDIEIISMEECCKIFDLNDVGTSSARFDLDKLYHVNSVYMRKLSQDEIFTKLKEFAGEGKFEKSGWERVKMAIHELQIRSRTFEELAQMSEIYGMEGNYYEKIEPNACLLAVLKNINQKNMEDVENWLRNTISENGSSLKEIAPLLRLAITKRKVAPSLFEVIKILGADLFYARLKNALGVN